MKGKQSTAQERPFGSETERKKVVNYGAAANHGQVLTDQLGRIDRSMGSVLLPDLPVTVSKQL